MIKILLLADYQKESERRLLRGLVSYANTRGGCLLHRMSSFPLETKGHSSEIVEAACRLGVDAVFGIWMDPTPESVKALGKPVFVRTITCYFPDLPMLSGRYNEIGHMAAEFFLKQHYNNVAFFGYKDILWSEERLQGFAERVAAGGLAANVYLAKDTMREREQVAGWLEDLPKPVGIFACNDEMARILSEVCQFKGICVPDDVALLGADNDEFLCNISYPGISSVNLDFEGQGYHLGESIFKMVEEGRMWPERIPIEPTGIIERDSTVRHRISDKYVRAILDYMEQNYASDICVADIISHVPLSRRAIEIRFRKEMHPDTMLSYLNRLRVEHMCRLLRRDDISISQAAEKSGFTDATNVWRVFRKIKGVTPSEYVKDLASSKIRERCTKFCKSKN